MATFPVDLLRPRRNDMSQAADPHLRGRPKYCKPILAFPNVFVLETYPSMEVVEHVKFNSH